MAPAHELIDGLKAEQVLADKAYDADSFCEKIEDQGARGIPPPRRHRKLPWNPDCVPTSFRWGIEVFLPSSSMGAKSFSLTYYLPLPFCSIFNSKATHLGLNLLTYSIIPL
uniref:Transposase and inactivated derivatives n=1 Tax=Magnetospirillum gryphiswaldense TaxID=55518 RepID=A4U2B1_9PROT|nr:transposase and inactivated derivatives [Magnetospirillum gryphiswaldense MSR-1]